PIFEAAARHGLPVAIHVHRTPGLCLLSPVGYSSYYAENHPLYSMVYVTHLVSLLTEGVFEQFPSLKFVLTEGGSAWAAPVLWRLDRAFAIYGSELPHLRRPPSEIAREHI